MNNEHITLHTQALTAHPYFSFFGMQPKKEFFYYPTALPAIKFIGIHAHFVPFVMRQNLNGVPRVEMQRFMRPLP